MYIKRDNYLKKLINLKDKDIVKIITGIRRCGKSVLLNNIYYDYLISQNIQPDHIIKMSFDMKKWEKYKNSDELYKYISDQIKDDERYYIFFDEIQMVEHFEEVVNGIKAEFNSDIYLTGSNSKFLSSDINTIFRGRGIQIKIFPLSFAEYFSYRNIDKNKAFEEYVMFGGMPYLVTENDAKAKADYLNMLNQTIVSKDVIDRYKIKNPEVFNAITDLLCSSVGSNVSSLKIANTLKSNAIHSVDNETVSRYLSYLCDSFLFYKVFRYDLKGKQYLKSQNKYYICDIGIRNARLNYRQTEMTHIIENIVYIDLVRKGYIVDIGKNHKKEIDFVAKDLFGNNFYIQVSYSLENPKILDREVAAFSGLDDGYKKIVITMDTSPFINLGNGYKKLHLFDFLLDDEILNKI